jgi:hypothetical protein
MSWSRSTEQRARVAIALAVLVALAGATRASAAPCDHFAWPLAIERDQLAAGSVERVASGAKRPSIPDAALELALLKPSQVAYVVPPERKPKSRGGVVIFSAVSKPGLYQFTFSSGAWVDVVQDGKILPVAEETGDPECSIIRKSLRYRLGSGPMVLQVSDADVKAIRFVIRAVE